MSTEVANVIPSWTVSSTSAASPVVTTTTTAATTTATEKAKTINQLELPTVVRSTTEISTSEESTEPIESTTVVIITENDNYVDNDIVEEQEAETEIFEHDYDDDDVEDKATEYNNKDDGYMTPRSPATSLTSLPPLPDLIPIRKSNINHQNNINNCMKSSSSSLNILNNKSSPTTKTLSLVTKTPTLLNNVSLENFSSNITETTIIDDNCIKTSSHKSDENVEETVSNIKNSSLLIVDNLEDSKEDTQTPSEQIDENHVSEFLQYQCPIETEEKKQQQIEELQLESGENNIQLNDNNVETVTTADESCLTTENLKDISSTEMVQEDNQNVNPCTTTTPAAITIQPAALQQQQKKRGRPKYEPITPAFNDINVTETKVQHRKSDRRRIPRDIFFLFEEHPSNRRRNKKTNKRPQTKRGRPAARPKAIETNTTKLSTQTGSTTTAKKSQQHSAQLAQTTSKQESSSTTAAAATTATTTTAASANSENLVPRVNPIFLWVKQDDTRIVEVRCEDYDKRNRIRLTKTANGWRAIPRTDTSTSRVVKLLPNPLVRIKQELQQQTRSNLIETAKDDTATTEEFIRRMKKSKKKKKKKKKKKRKHISDDDDNENMTDVRELLSPSPKDVIVYESTNHEREEVEEENAVVEQHPVHLPPINLESEPNNNDTTSDLTKNLTQISDDIELDMPFMQHLDGESTGMMALCPETGVFQPIITQQVVGQQSTNEHVVLSDSFDPNDVCHDVDTKHLKDLLDEADLLQHCDNAMTGAELIDSLVKRGCEDNHISEDDEHHLHHNPGSHDTQHHGNVNLQNHQKNNTICLTNDFDNEEDELLMQPEPVEDIISRLGESLAASPKCLSFNEAGEIEDLHGELFQTSTQSSDPFSNRTTFEELSITIKDLEKTSSETSFNTQTKSTNCESTNQQNIERSTTIVSPDSCVEELPKDLTCKKGSENVVKPQCQSSNHQPERTLSRSSDAIQSPQPSGLPAVPPSPDLMHSKNKSVFLDQLLNNSSTSPKICSSVTVTPIKVTNTSSQQQKEPLDLGKHRKSASPTVSCSEEAKRSQPVSVFNDDINSDEPLQKRIKTEPETDEKNESDKLIEMLSSGKDPDPLTQLRLLISNPEWKVPDPILVPKDRLSAVLASPAREIPHLLTTRPELRLPEAFAYPSILQDPDILVISMAQLETILEKQVELTRPKNTPVPLVTIEAVNKPRIDKTQSLPPIEIPPAKKTNTSKSLLSPMAPLLASGLANDIDAATLAAFNQMLWLPYLGQMAPELFKAMAGLPNSANVAEMLPFLIQQQQQQQQQSHEQQQPQQRQHFPPSFSPNTVPNPMAFQNPLEFAMWQEALNQAQMQRALKLNSSGQRDPNKKASGEPKQNSANRNFNMAALFAQKNSDNMRNQQQQQQQQHQNSQTTKGRSMIGVNPFRPDINHSQMRQPSLLDKSGGNNMRSANPFFGPNSGGLEISAVRKTKPSPQQHSQNEQKPRVTCKSLSNLLQPDRLMQVNANKVSNLMTMPSFEFSQQFNHQQQHQIESQQPSLHSQVQGHQYHNIHSLPNNNSNTNNNNNNNSNSGGQSLQGKLKVKPGAHLLDPAAMQRRLLHCDEIPEVGSTTNGLDEMINDPNAPLWHPLFGSSQKTGYTSPWQWTTVTATGE